MLKIKYLVKILLYVFFQNYTKNSITRAKKTQQKPDNKTLNPKQKTKNTGHSRMKDKKQNVKFNKSFTFY